MNLKILSIALATHATCGGSDTTGPTQPEAGACSYTFSGAVTGTFSGDCPGGIGAFDSTKSTVAVTLPTISMTNTVSASVSVSNASGLANRTYSLSDANTQGVCALVDDTSNGEWIAGSASNGSPAQGTLTINVISNTEYASANGSIGYYVHGTADATLEAVTQTGATGTVTVHAVF